MVVAYIMGAYRSGLENVCMLICKFSSSHQPCIYDTSFISSSWITVAQSPAVTLGKVAYVFMLKEAYCNYES